MCGIAGILSGGAPVDGIEVGRMCAAIAHRGPDGEGVKVKGPVGFGHRRLAIIDLSQGQQPMVNRSGSLWITFNGEIYNFRDLRQELEKSYAFSTNSDTEVILCLYERYGEDCVNFLRGMFAFAIYDFGKEELFVARDHLGQKPLYYAQTGKQFLFASEIKALLAVRPELRQMDHSALYEYMCLRIITPPRSMFRGIRKLPPGHSLVYSKGRLTVKRYWDLEFVQKRSGSVRELVDELDDRISESVRYHLVSDVPVGAFLSGGMDSSLIVAMVKKHQERIPTFSGDVPYEGFSEIPYCRQVSERYGTEAHELTINPSLIRQLPDLVWHLDEPSDPLSTCLFYLSELVRRHVKVVLGGDGGDELFGGYDRYFGNTYVSWYAMLPETLRRTVFARLLRLVPQGSWYRSVGHQLSWMHQLSFYDADERYARSLGYFFFSDQFRGELFTDSFQEKVGMFDPEANLQTYFNADNAKELVDRMLYTDAMTRLPDHPVMILDRTTMAHGLEARSPFLDHKLAEFCAGLDPRVKVRGRRLRYIQFQLAKRYLPEQVLARKKQGFSSPLVYLLGDEFRHLYAVLLRDSRLVATDCLRAEGVEDLLRRHLHGGEDHGQRLWQLCNAEIWYRMCIEGESREATRELIQRAA